MQGLHTMLRRRWANVGACFALALGLFGMTSGPAMALPAFAIQTGQTCNACHVGGFGPQLTPLGREFKMTGYTLGAGGGFDIPLSAMAVASYVYTNKDQATPPAAHYSVNDNATIDQVSLFFAGGFGSHFGAFVQTTYDGVARSRHWDNLDLRAVTTATVHGANVVLGATINNAPTVTDAFNTLPAWGFPYTGSSLAPSAGSAPLIGSLAQNTLGATGYVWVGSQFYAEFGGYGSPDRRTLGRLGVDPYNPGDIKGVAPYGRIAYQRDEGDWNIEAGAFVLDAKLHPGRDNTTGFTDRYTDFGVDGSYQYYAANHDVFTLNARYTHERRNLQASEALGGAAAARSTLNDFRLDGSYYWRNQIGGTVGIFDTTGSSDAQLYANNRTLKPNSSGVNLQLDATPFGTGKSALGRRFNLRVGVQYVAYSKFDGAAKNYDGGGHNASDNNTLRIFTWVAY